MESVRTYKDPAAAQADRSILTCFGIPGYVNGCVKNGYSLLVASGLLLRAREILETASSVLPEELHQK